MHLCVRWSIPQRTIRELHCIIPGQPYASAAIMLGITLMRIYWSLKSVPELSDLPSEERRRVWRAAYWKTARHWQFWAGLVGIGLFTFIGNALIGHPPI